MNEYENIQKAMGVDIAISETMAQKILLWISMYKNSAPWLTADVRSLELPAAVCTEMTRLVTMESKYTITGDELVSKAFEQVYGDLPRVVEYACSSGGIIFKPYLDGYSLNVDYVQAGNFYPTAFDSSGKITGCIFSEFKRKGKKLYTRLEYHQFSSASYKITNRVFVNKNSKVSTTITNIVDIGTEAALSDVEEWAYLEPYQEFKNATCPLFVYFKIPIANNIDTFSPLGVSCFARAENQIRDADEQYSAALWEFRSKETAIQASDEFFKKDREGKVLIPKGKERIYHNMGDILGRDNIPFFNAYSPEIRDQSFFNGYNRIIQKVEFNCGLAYGTLSDPQTVDKTAEEIKSSKQRSYATVKSIQNGLDIALRDLVDAMQAWTIIGGVFSGEKVEAAFSWDDSIVIDKEHDREQDRKDVAMGIMRLDEYRAKWYGETLEKAKANLPDVADITD